MATDEEMRAGLPEDDMRGMTAEDVGAERLILQQRGLRIRARLDFNTQFRAIRTAEAERGEGMDQIE